MVSSTTCAGAIYRLGLALLDHDNPLKVLRRSDEWIFGPREEYERRGWAARCDRRWYLTPQGFLISNQLIGELLDIQERATLETTLPRLRQGFCYA